jgi:hypothetical protein
LGQRLVSGARQTEARQRGEEQLAQAKATQVALIAYKTQVASPEFVEQTARDKLGWSREGETVVQMLVTPAPTPLPTPAPRPTPTPEPTIWEWLWRLIVP